MILLSLCAKGSFERYRFGEPRIIDTPFVGDAAIEELQAASTGRRMLFLIHGFNSDQDGAIASYRIIEQELKNHGLLGPGGRYDDVCGVLWPGSVPVGYWIAEHRAAVAGGQLSEILGQLKCASINIETHSLGARVAMGVLEADCPTIREVILTAPAIDNNAIDTGTKWGGLIISKVGRVLVCYSSRDSVLSGAYRWFGSVFHGGIGGHQGLGCTGPDKAELPGNVRLCDGSQYIPDHSAWRSADKFYGCWGGL